MYVAPCVSSPLLMHSTSLNPMRAYIARPNLLSFPLAAFEYAPWILYTNVKMNQQYHDVI